MNEERVSWSAWRDWQPYSQCPCGCEVIGAKLSVKSGHVHGCTCRSCLGRRVRRSGRAAQARGYRRLGGTAPFTPGNEENSGTHSVEIQVEAKSGRQVPASLLKFARTEWARRAWSQAERAIPAGVQAEPSIYAEREGWQLLVTLLKVGKGGGQNKT